MKFTLTFISVFFSKGRKTIFKRKVVCVLFCRLFPSGVWYFWRMWCTSIIPHYFLCSSHYAGTMCIIRRQKNKELAFPTTKCASNCFKNCYVPCKLWRWRRVQSHSVSLTFQLYCYFQCNGIITCNIVISGMPFIPNVINNAQLTKYEIK